MFLLASEDRIVVILATKILARLLVISGPVYMKKFEEKTGGIVIVQRRLRRWWSITSLWPICFAILFGQDVAAMNMERDFNLFNLIDALNVSSKSQVVYPEIFPVLAAMLENGLRAITKEQSDPDSPMNKAAGTRSAELGFSPQKRSTHSRPQSMSPEWYLNPLGESIAIVK